MLIQWLGHSAFKVTIGSAQILFDPFLKGNPQFKGDFAATIKGATHVLVTHMHNDHFGDTIEILKSTGATLVSNYEIASYVTSEFSDAKTVGVNIGGTAHLGELAVTMTRAHHSSGYTTPDGRMIYGGEAGGLIARVDSRSVYHLGDTSAFSDMALIDELHRPQVGLVPIGDWFTMGPREAALAVDRFFHFKYVIPCHWGTYPNLAQSTEDFVRFVHHCIVWAAEPGEAREF